MVSLKSLAHVVQHLPIPVVLTDDRGRVVCSSNEAGGMLGLPDPAVSLSDLLAALPALADPERATIPCDAGPHELVVLSTATTPAPGTPADVATLAGEVAHDFNNLLGVIINYASLAAAAAPAESQQERDLAEVLTASRRAATIADRMRRLSTGTDLS